MPEFLKIALMALGGAFIGLITVAIIILITATFRKQDASGGK